MKRQTQFITLWVSLLATATIGQAQEESSVKWSRQLENVGGSDTDTLDWVPLAQPLEEASKDRSANGRVLTYSQSFPPSARFGELSKPTGGQFDFPFQFQRFPNSGPQALHLRHQGPPPLKNGGPQEPTSQSFFKFEMPFHNEANQAQAPPTLQTGYQIQHTFGNSGGLPAPSTLFSPPSLFGQSQPHQFSEFQKPFAQALGKPLHQQNYVQDILPVKSLNKPLPTQAALQSVTPQVFPIDPAPEPVFGLNKAGGSSSAGGTAGNQQQQQEVQLLYVPYDTLYNQQRQSQSSSSLGSNSNFEVNKFNVNAGLPAVNPYQINQFYTQDPSVGSDFFSSGTTSRPSSTTTAQPQSHLFQNFGQSQSQGQFTTAKPKPKAHQPPLAMFLLRPNARPSQSDVVAALRNANTISVIDAPTKRTPDIFVGPAGMPIPEGFIKFDLPYLSQLTHSRDLSDVPFFVAPLSYRTPNGFNKILLPEPHVGSIVINRARDSGYLQDPIPSQQQPQPVRSQRPSSTRNPFETTTQAQRVTDGPAPTRGNKFSYYYVQDGIKEVSSPKLPVKQERHKKKRPQHVEQPVYRPPAKTQNPFDTLNQIGGDDFFSSIVSKPSTSTTQPTSTSTSTTSTTSTTAIPQTLFTFGSRPQVEFPSSNGQLYPQFEAAPQPVQEHLPRLTTRPPTSTTPEEEQRMKQYFRQQDAFRQRLQTTNAPFEQVQYTPTSVEYEAPQPTTTQKSKHRVTVYTPVVPVTTSDVGYNVDPQAQTPLNHRPIYNQNEVIDNGNLEYEPNPYHVPSELPSLTPDIPGLVNDLQEKDKLAATTTPLNEPEPETRPTRRPALRTRKPAISKVVTTSSVSYSESDSNVKLPTHRIRRPYGTRVNSATGTGSGDNAEETISSTRRPGSTRNPLLRNPNRIRYQPTTEERQTLKVKPKKHNKASKNGKPSEDQDLEYQRDVLKQNYPVFRAPSRRPTSPTAIPSSYDVSNTEGPASESQQVYTVTPSNSIDTADQGVYPGSLLEPMQIAQHYNEFSKDNYGPGYFPNQEDLNPTEAIIRNEVSPIYTTLATTAAPTTTTTTTTTIPTTDPPVTTTTRRSPFIRRNYPRVRTTTTTEATVTATPSEERPSIRTRIPPRRVVKVRQRQRRPLHPASSTNAPEEEAEPITQKPNLRKLSRYNQDQTEKEQTSHTSRRRYKQPFQLEGQESQWSPASETGNSNSNSNDNRNSNSFKPLNPKYSSKSESHSFENEPDIVTAGPTDQPETYEFNVAANLGGSRTTPALKEPNLKPEKSFAELLEEVMGKAPEDLATATPTSSTYGRVNRRGKWKKARGPGGAENNENFETAESQNLAPQLLNSLYASNEKSEEGQKTTTPMTPVTVAETTTIPELVTTTTVLPTTPEEYEMTTSSTTETTTVPSTLAVNDESATRRMDTAADVDDLDTQPSIFAEVRQQLHDLFAIDEKEDSAATAALAAVGKRRQEYTSIKRNRLGSFTGTSTTTATPSTTEDASEALPTTTTVSTPSSAGKEDDFHKDLMQHVVYATSTSTKVTSETEICYRGRCIRSEDLPANHKLH